MSFLRGSRALSKASTPETTARRVVIDNATLRHHRSCRGAYTSPEWSEKEQALIYADWDKTVTRLLKKPGGIDQIEWFVNHKLVPMTKDQFDALKKEHSDG